MLSSMLFLVALLLGSWVVVLEGAEDDAIERADNRRPIWNMGHMVNKIEQINEFLNLGANSIEVDIAFDELGYAEYTYHGVPCDCKRWCRERETIADFIEALSAATTPGNPKFRKELTLVVFDLKTGGFDASRMYKSGKAFAELIQFFYWKSSDNAGRAYIILSLPKLDHYEFIKAFREHFDTSTFKNLLEERVGYDFSGNDDLGLTRIVLNKAGVNDREHVWQSDGITNCILRGLDRVRAAVAIRDFPTGNINKVYYWTIDADSSVRDALDARVDGIMTNKPDVIVNVLNEVGYKSKFRLATYEDNPWETFKSPTPG